MFFVILEEKYDQCCEKQIYRCIWNVTGMVLWALNLRESLKWTWSMFMKRWQTNTFVRRPFLWVMISKLTFMESKLTGQLSRPFAISKLKLLGTLVIKNNSSYFSLPFHWEEKKRFCTFLQLRISRVAIKFTSFTLFFFSFFPSFSRSFFLSFFFSLSPSLSLSSA